MALGVGIGETTAGVISYNNVNRGRDLVGDIALGGLIGSFVGGTIGYFAGPTIAGWLASTSTISGGLAFVCGLGSTGGAIALSTVGKIALTGAIGLTAVGAFGATIMFSKGFGPRMGHNQFENKQFNQLCNKDHLTKEETRVLHDYISHEN